MPRAFFNRRAVSWDETVSERDVTRLEQMSRRLDIRPGATVLDVGTGTGVFIPFILSKIGQKGRVVALDFAEEMLKIARSKGFNGKIDYLCVDVTGIPLGGGIFDCIVCYSSFPHFQDKPAALAELNRVAKSGGRLSICHTSSRAKINHIHRQLPDVRNDTIPDGEEMRALLETAGFTDVEIADGSDSYLASARKPGEP